ncbi:MAG TPA: metabolite traffic protein EboE [Chthoniobacteraceae bacterium]|nr:metabolite traffic protein EboE [Chthoniobacteraceae bacterium]
MILQHRPPLHLTYCLNIHPGESWSDNIAAIRDKAVAVKQRIAPDQWFGLGLRISQFAAQRLASDESLVEEARELFNANQLYPFSVNAFPYGRFHASAVKEQVYNPDWRAPERRDYTMQVADAFSHFLPPSVDGSISTVPGSYKPWIDSEADKLLIAKNLAVVVAYLSAIRDDTGQEIHIGLEPEPDCFLETTGETISFFKDVLFAVGVDEVARLLRCERPLAEEVMRRHLGVCLDTCHVALQYEDPLAALRAYKSEGIRISKIQLSAALVAPGEPETWQELKRFNEPVYLHQTKALLKDGSLGAWYDLPDAIREGSKRKDVEEVRVHFHVPLFFNGAGVLGSTSVLLTPEFFHELRSGISSHLEIETYTFDVLPEDLRSGDVVKSICREYSWVLDQLGAH